MPPRAPDHRRARLLVPLLVVLLAFLSLTAFVYLPNTDCADPVCVRQRYSVFLEVDAFAQVEPIAFELETAEGEVSLASVLSAGGVEVLTAIDQMDLPYDPAAGRLDRADLYQYSRTWRNRTPPQDADAQLYALLAPGIVSDTGENLFGLMFDYEGREGFAVAPQQIVRAFAQHEAEYIPLLQLRTFIHEMLHALNRRHLDAAQMPDGRLTIEAPTKCIADVQRSAWRLLEPPLLALSPSTIRFFQSADRASVLPGVGHSPFELRRVSARECEDVRANRAPPPVSSRWEYTARRLQRLLGVSTARAQEAGNSADRIDAELRLQVAPAAYPLGYPIAVRLLAHNTGERELALKERLSPSFGLVHIDLRAAGEEEWHTLRPLAWYEPADDDGAMLAPGEHTEQTVPVFFGEDGWSFAQPGEYEIRARLQLGDDFPEIASEVVSVTVVAPTSERDRAALEPLLDQHGALDEDIGRLIAFDGRIGAPQDMAPIERVVHEFPDTALGSALKLTLASHLLRPPIDTRTGTRPKPDADTARRLLESVCRESGIVALKAELLARHGEVDALQGLSVDDLASIAWDGADAARRPVPTYVDDSLRVLGTRIGFAAGRARLDDEALAAVARLAHELRSDAGRIVVVGHADAEGDCAASERLGLERAQAVRRALMRHGVPASRIQAVTMGARRALDLGASEQARTLNRRVELLVEEQGEPVEAADP